jgi:hypothetical protein
MLLTELLNKTSPTIKTSKSSTSGILTHSTQQVIGGGAQAIAYLHKKFPGKVIKTIQLSGTDDPVYQFMRLAMKHQNNPYFPKIYSVKMYPTTQDSMDDRADEFDILDTKGDYNPPPDTMNYTAYVVMEKLKPLSNITNQDLEKFGLEDFSLPPSYENIWETS